MQSSAKLAFKKLVSDQKSLCWLKTWENLWAWTHGYGTSKSKMMHLCVTVALFIWLDSRDMVTEGLLKCPLPQCVRFAGLNLKIIIDTSK